MIFCYLFPLLFYLARSEGEFLVVRTPASIEFKWDEPIDQDLIPAVCSASLGFTVHQVSDWKGLKITDPFHFAEAIVILYIDGISSLGSTDLQKIQLDGNQEEEVATWNAIKNEIVKRFPMENNTLLRVELGFGNSDLSNVKVNHLNKNDEEDVSFLQELMDLENHSHSIFRTDGIPDLYWYVLKGLHSLNDIKGAYDPSTLEAKQKVNEALSKLGNVYDKAYRGRVLVAAIVSDSSHTRRTRSALEEDDLFKNATDINAVPPTDESFSAIFNIILWFMVALVLSLVAICDFRPSFDQYTNLKLGDV